jgi:Putative DNA-binding domain
VLGAERFDALILSYIKENPSSSWTLRDLGAKLPAFLEDHPEFGGKRHRLAVDVAHLEWAYVDAYDGKRLTPLTSDDLQAIGPNSRLSIQPHLRLLALSYPVDELVLAVRRETPESEIVSSAANERGSQTRITLPSMKRGKLYLAVHRFDDSVYYRPIEREMFLLLATLRDGSSIAEALEQAFKTTRLTPEEQAGSVQQCFAHASELGWLCPRRETDEDPDQFVM